MYSQSTWNPNLQRSWVPCLLRDDDRYVLRAKDGGEEVQTTGTIYLHYRIPAASFLGNNRLFVDGVRIGLNRANAQNFVSKLVLLGINPKGASHIWEQNTQLNSQGDHIINVAPAVDLSQFPTTDFRITLESSTPGALRIAYTLVSTNYR
jgi:hypothetical protein